MNTDNKALADRFQQYAQMDRAITLEPEMVRRVAAALTATPSAQAGEVVVPDGLIEALRNQRQVDEEGIECGVSRQAVDEAIEILESLTTPSRMGRGSYAPLHPETRPDAAPGTLHASIAAISPQADKARGDVVSELKRYLSHFPHPDVVATWKLHHTTRLLWKCYEALTATPSAQAGEVPEAELIALVAGPYHYHHKMDDAAEREGKAFDRCRELTIQNIRTWCATHRAMFAAPTPQPQGDASPEVSGCGDAMEALRRAEMKLAAYVGVCKGDKELTEAVLPMVRAALSAQPRPASAPVGVEGQGEFWTWLRQAYNFTSAGNFTAYNMEVAYQAGRDSALAQQPQPSSERSGVPVDVVREYLDARDAYEAATRPPNSHAPAPLLKHGDPIVLRYQKARTALAAQKPTAVPVGVEGDAVRERVGDAVADALHGTYDCTRVWEAWYVGTMSQDDFHLVRDDESRLLEIADAAIAALAQQSVAVDEKAIAAVASDLRHSAQHDDLKDWTRGFMRLMADRLADAFPLAQPQGASHDHD